VLPDCDLIVGTEEEIHIARGGAISPPFAKFARCRKRRSC